MTLKFASLLIVTMLLVSCTSTHDKELSDKIISLETKLSQVQTDLNQMQMELQAAQSSLVAINNLGPQRLKIVCNYVHNSYTSCIFNSIGVELRLPFELPENFYLVELLTTDDQGYNHLGEVFGLWYQSSTEKEMIVTFSVLPKSTSVGESLVKVFDLSVNQALFATSDLDTQLSTETREMITTLLSTHYGVTGVLQVEWDFRTN
jgi:outer membrane murein-binding lipoprotein Lpp